MDLTEQKNRFFYERNNFLFETILFHISFY